MRQVILVPGLDGFWVARCVSLPAVISQGETKEEALQNIREAIDMYEEWLRDKGEPIPEERAGAELVAV